MLAARQKGLDSSQEVEAGGSEILGHLQIHSKFETSVGTVSTFKNERKKGRKVRGREGRRGREEGKKEMKSLSSTICSHST